VGRGNPPHSFYEALMSQTKRLIEKYRKYFEQIANVKIIVLGPNEEPPKGSYRSGIVRLPK